METAPQSPGTLRDPGERAVQQIAESPSSPSSSSIEPAGEISESPTFTPFDAAPQLTNRQEVGEALEASYPPALRDAGVSGRAEIWVRIGTDGLVERVAIHRSSGDAALDEAALAVGRVMRFTPASNRGRVVPVWVSIPITFQVR
jgi:protein TonB